MKKKVLSVYNTYLTITCLFLDLHSLKGILIDCNFHLILQKRFTIVIKKLNILLVSWYNGKR